MRLPRGDNHRSVVREGSDLRVDHLLLHNPQQAIRSDGKDQGRKRATLTNAPGGLEPLQCLPVEPDLHLVLAIKVLHSGDDHRGCPKGLQGPESEVARNAGKRGREIKEDQGRVVLLQRKGVCLMVNIHRVG